jgi:Domain of unknown function (DUF4157)
MQTRARNTVVPDGHVAVSRAHVPSTAVPRVGLRPSQVPVASGVEAAIEGRRSAGRPLAPAVRRRAEAELRADLGSVRVHGDGSSDTIARALGARAFTTGSDVFFRRGAFDPDSRRGWALVVHELAHAVQQRGEPATGSLTVGPDDDAYERTARAAGLAAAAGRPVRDAPRPVAGGTRGRRLARQPDVLVADDERRLSVRSLEVHDVRNIDLTWYRRIQLLRAGGLLRVDDGVALFKDPTYLRLDVLEEPPGHDQLTLDGTVHLDGFDAIRGEMHATLRFENPTKFWRSVRGSSPDELWKRLESSLAQAVPGLDAAQVADELKGLLGQLAVGALTPDGFVLAAGRAAGRAVRSANVKAVEAALWRFLAEVGPQLDVTAQLVGLGVLGTRVRGGLRFTRTGPEATVRATRLIVAPAGMATSTTAPAVGFYEETRSLDVHKRFMFGVLQKLDPDAIGRAGSLFVEKLPTAGYLEYLHARRYGDHVEVGIRLGVRFSTSDLAHYVPHPTPQLSAADQRRAIVGGYQDLVHPRVRDGGLAPLAELAPPLPTEIPYNVGVTIFGSFDWFGGK